MRTTLTNIQRRSNALIVLTDRRQPMSNQSQTKDHKLWVSQAASGNISAQYISVSVLLKTKVAFSLSCSSISSLLIIKKRN